MRKTSKLLALLLAFVMVFGAVAPAMAAEEVTDTVTLHKILMNTTDFGKFTEGTKGINEEEYVGKSVTDITEYFGASAKDQKDVYFALKFAEDYQSEEDNEKKPLNGRFVKYGDDKLTPAIPLEATDKVEEAVGGLTTDNGLKLNTSTLKGKFEIVEVKELSTYIGEEGETLTGSKAVPVKITLPLVNKDGVVKEAHVYPKNTEDKPKTEKDFADKLNLEEPRTKEEKAKPEGHNVGDVVNYKVQTEIPADTKWETAFWDDTMTEGLTYNEGKLVITYKGQALDSGDYSLKETGKGFTLELTANGLEKINGQSEKAIIEITYSATINEKAVVKVPESNDVTFHYGNDKNHGNTPKPNKPNENGELKVTKTWGEGAAKYDAKFTLINAQTGDAVKNNVDGEPIENPITITAGEEMTYTWNKLDKDIEYKVVEDYKAGYAAWYEEQEEAGFIVVENRKSNNPQPQNPDEPKVVTYGKKFVKTNETGDVRLSGAKFVVQNKDGKYLVKSDAADRSAFEAAQKAYEEAVKNNAGDIEAKKIARDNAWNSYLKDMTKWTNVDELDEGSASTNNLVVLESNDQGQFEIAGLAPGTYKLVEIKAPDTYAKLSGPVEFTIGENGETIDNIEYVKDSKNNDAQQVVNKKVTIPQTGGIGTIIFTVAGLVIMAGAAFVLIKNNKKEEEIA